jgi:hypothetical protein
MAPPATRTAAYRNANSAEKTLEIFVKVHGTFASKALG